MSEHPSPLVPADVDLHGYGFMPLYGHRLFGSEFNARCSDSEWRAGVTLWWAAWNQVPAASLPNDDAALCRLADLGRDVRGWRKIRANALHGFILCSDGRLYHKALAEYALQAWDRRVKDRARKERWRAGRNADGDGDRTVPVTGTDTGTTPVTDASRNEDGTAERERERERDSESSKKKEGPPLRGSSSPDPECAAALAAWNAMAERAGLPIAQRLTETRQRKLALRLAEAGGLDGWGIALAKIEASAFCTGKRTSWRADLDFVLQPKSFTKLMEGSYDDQSGHTQANGHRHDGRGPGHQRTRSEMQIAADLVARLEAQKPHN